MKYTRSGAFWGNYAQVAIGSEDSFKWGMIDRKGVEVVPTIYDSIIYMGGEYVLVNIGQYDDLENMEFVSGLWGVVSVDGEYKIALKYSELHWANKECLLLIAQDSQTGRQGVIDLNEGVVIPFEYLAIYPMSGNLLQVRRLDDKLGVIDLDHNIIIEPIYDEFDIGWQGVFGSDSWIAVEKENERYYIDYQCNRILF